MQKLRSIILAILAMVAWAPAVQAQNVADHLGPLKAPLGTDGPWNAGLQGGWFLLTNTSDPNSIRYFSMDGQPVTGERVIRTTIVVLPDQGAQAYGGILFDFHNQEGYFGFTIAGDGRAILWDRTPDGFKDLVSDTGRAKLDGSDVMEVRQTPTRVTFHLNGEELFHADNENGFANTFGIIGIGQGRIGFNGFSVTETAAQAPLPTPGGGGLPSPGGGGLPLPKPGGGGTAGAPQQPLPQPGQQPQQQPSDPFAGASEQDIYVSKVVLGTTLGVFFHEFGHALIGETGLPATGPEEDVADGFSAFVLSATVEEGGLSPQEQQFFEDVVKYSSLLWFYQGQAMEREGKKAPWQGEHAPDLKRFRNSFCIIYGSNPQRYEDLALRVGLQDRTKARCKDEHRKRYNAWETILKTVSRNLGPDSPGNYPADHPGGKIHLTFVESNSKFGNAVEQLLRDTGSMQAVVAGLEKMFVWPRDLSVEFRDCEEINAWYDPQQAKVTMCYSLVEFFSNVVFQAEGGGAGPQGPTQPTGPQGPTGQQLDQIAQFFVGTWQAQMYDQQGQQVNMAAQYAANFTYASAAQSASGSYQEQGQWAAQAAGQNQIMLSHSPTQPQGAQPSQVVVEVLDQNRVQTNGVIWTRVQ